MTRPAAFLTLALLLAVSLAPTLRADEVWLVDGRVFQVSEWRIDGDEIVMQTDRGEVRVPRSKVKRIVVEGAVERETPRPERSETTSLQSAETAGDLLGGRQLGVSTEALESLTAGNVAAALDSLDRSPNSESADTLLFKSALLLKAADFYHARATIDPLLDSAPDDGYARFLAAQADYYLGEWAEAEINYGKAAELLPRLAQMRTAIEEKLATIRDSIGRTEVYGDNFVVKTTSTVVDRARADEIVEQLEEALRELGPQLGAMTENRILVLIMTGNPEMPDGSRRSGAYDGSIIISSGVIGSRNQRSVLTHELVHALLQPRTRGNCPIWLHEGLAQMLSGVSSETLGVDIAAALSADTTPGLYIESLTLLEHLQEDYTFGPIYGLLDLLEQGRSPDEAVEIAFGKSLEQLRTERDQRFRRP